MKETVITRRQFEQMKEVFEKYNPEHVLWTEESNSIGPIVLLKFMTQNTITVDITDIESW